MKALDEIMKSGKDSACEQKLEDSREGTAYGGIDYVNGPGHSPMALKGTQI